MWPMQIYQYSVIFSVNWQKLTKQLAISKCQCFENFVLFICRGNDCENVHAYLTDVWRFGLVVFSLEKMRGWRIYDHTFFPEPLAARYTVSIVLLKLSKMNVFQQPERWDLIRYKNSSECSPPYLTIGRWIMFLLPRKYHSISHEWWDKSLLRHFSVSGLRIVFF